MRHLYLLTLVVLTFDLGWGQERRSSLQSWLPEDLPNPQTNPKACGLGHRPGYVCDPNNILTRNQRDTLNWFLKGISNFYDSSMCPCSQYFCDFFDGPRFYRVAVAIVPRLRLPLNTNGEEVSVLDQAQVFAYRLENELWNMGSCGENIVILYSRDDQALVTMTGSTAGLKLDANSRSLIHSMVGEHFADGRINEGLLRMVHEIELVLQNKDYYQMQMMAQTSQAGLRLSPWTLHFLLLLLPALLLTRFVRPS